MAELEDETDVLTRVRNPTIFNDDRKRVFLRLLEDIGTVSKAARGAGVVTSTVYKHRNDDAEFAEAWDEARAMYCDRLEEEAYRRAVEGTEKPVFFQGVQCGEVQEYSDTLMVTLLKANRPKKFRERLDMQAEVSMKTGVLVVPMPRPDEDDEDEA